MNFINYNRGYDVIVLKVNSTLQPPLSLYTPRSCSVCAQLSSDNVVLQHSQCSSTSEPHVLESPAEESQPVQ